MKPQRSKPNQVRCSIQTTLPATLSKSHAPLRTATQSSLVRKKCTQPAQTSEQSPHKQPALWYPSSVVYTPAIKLDSTNDPLPGCSRGAGCLGGSLETTNRRPPQKELLPNRRVVLISRLEKNCIYITLRHRGDWTRSSTPHLPKGPENLFKSNFKSPIQTTNQGFLDPSTEVRMWVPTFFL